MERATGYRGTNGESRAARGAGWVERATGYRGTNGESRAARGAGWVERAGEGGTSSAREGHGGGAHGLLHVVGAVQQDNEQQTQRRERKGRKRRGKEGLLGPDLYTDGGRPRTRRCQTFRASRAPSFCQRQRFQTHSLRSVGRSHPARRVGARVMQPGMMRHSSPWPRVSRRGSFINAACCLLLLM